MNLKVHPIIIAIGIIAIVLMLYRNVTCNSQLMEASERSSNSIPRGGEAIPAIKPVNDIDAAIRASTKPYVPNLAPYMQVSSGSCKQPVLWGKEHQGGWWICQDNLSKSTSCLVYSYGLGADWSFDLAAEEYGCEVHGFDPSGALWRKGMYGNGYENIDYAQLYPSPKKFFHNWGIGAADRVIFPPKTVPQDWPGLGDPPMSFSNSEAWELRSIENTIETLGHENSTLSILKIDVEGAEWDALLSFLNNPLVKERVNQGRLPQLLLEFHWDPDSRSRNKRNSEVLQMVSDLHYVPWRLTRHVGSECCLDVSYVWVGEKKRLRGRV